MSPDYCIKSVYMFRYNRKQAGWQKRVEPPFHPVNFPCRRAPAPAEALLDSTAIKWYRRRKTAVQTTGFRAISLRLKMFWAAFCALPSGRPLPGTTTGTGREEQTKNIKMPPIYLQKTSRRFPHQPPWYAPDEFTTSALFLLCHPARPALFLPASFSS